MVTRRCRIAAAGTGLLAALTLSSCGGSGSPAHRTSSTAGPRPVTAAEADRLAVTRFLNYRDKGVRFSTEVATQNARVGITGYVDYRAGLGYAEVSDGTGSGFTFEWDTRNLAAWSTPGQGTQPPAALPPGTPGLRALNPSGNAVDAVLELVLQLGSDRPDNAQLIQSNGAQWLRRDTVAGTPVDVIQGPHASNPTAPSGTPAPAPTTPSSNAGGAVTYWIDATGKLLRLDAALGGGSTVTSVQIDAAGYRPFPRSPQLPTSG